MVASSSAKTRRTKKTDVLPLGLSAEPPTRDRWTVVASLALIAAVLAFYAPVIHNQFIFYDDDKYITENAHVKAGLNWATVEYAFSYQQANWHPLTWLSHALDCEIFGRNPVGPHLENVLLHAANAVLLFLLLFGATGFRWRSLMVAGLFALHPINVESVAWAAERKNVLSALFFLLALYAYGWYARKPGTRRYMTVAVCYALSLMAKPQVITFPFLLLLWDYWPLRRINLWRSEAGAREDKLIESTGKLNLASAIVEKIPLLALSGASALLTMYAQRAGGAVRSISQYGFLLRAENAVISYVRYMGKAVWPVKLIAIYPHPNHLYPVWQVGAALLLLLIITLVTLWSGRRRYLAVGWLWFLGSLVPMIGLVQVGEQSMADRYGYVSFIGLFIMGVWLIADWASARAKLARWLMIPALGCLLVLGILTWRQVGHWHDTESFWARILVLTPDNFVAHEEVASMLHREGKDEEAMAHVRAVLAIRPDHPAGNLILADYEQKQGDLAGAIEHYQIAAHSTTARPSARSQAYSGLGYAYLKTGELAKAKAAFEDSLGLSPRQPKLIVAVGLLAEGEGDFAGAARRFSQALEFQPTDVGYLLLANALEKEGKTDEANAARERAASVSQNLDRAQMQADSLLNGK